MVRVPPTEQAVRDGDPDEEEAEKLPESGGDGFTHELGRLEGGKREEGEEHDEEGELVEQTGQELGRALRSIRGRSPLPRSWKLGWVEEGAWLSHRCRQRSPPLMCSSSFSSSLKLSRGGERENLVRREAKRKT